MNTGRRRTLGRGGRMDGRRPRPSLRAIAAAMSRIVLHSSEEGQSLVEFGLVVPLLLLVLTGIFSFGIIFNQYQVLTNATNSAARGFALSAPVQTGESTAPNNDACAYVATIVQGDVPGINTSKLTYKIVYTVAKSGVSTTYNGTGSSPPSCSSLQMTMSDSVQVTVTYPVSALLYSWTSKSYTLTAQTTEFVQ